ncbi:glycoside hydrolase family 3 N-terminal domain-containing protein [Acidipropionibacterium jensenii]|uniref:glycoside hydrolase family 3 N-terminal domain-containing protein n=1 Tax=Acidipropionibacterium jensenii TaxID=1749 RepID=UPI002647D108|nr:glycoside hydrolase family 3 N-terminal domain-containing protein [Acidipropionibacterium jensenii]MDN5996231.1 glycoside hydrolase family 3 protein [Acidipropionibacterium jensenii]
MSISRRALLVCGALAPTLSACAGRAPSGADPVTGSAPTSRSSSLSSSTSRTPATTTARHSGTPSAAPASSTRTSARQPVAGHCLMVGLPAGSDLERVATLVTRHRLAGVFMLGHWTSTSAIREATAAIHRAARAAGLPRAIIAADQEGGLVHNLTSPAFTPMPSAERLGAGDPAVCLSLASTAGSQMRRAGLNLVLAPVADVVDPRLGSANAPIGALHRGYGTNPDTVARFVTAAVTGFRQGGVATSVKHFPGLGAVRANTDLAVATDTTTSVTSPGLKSFRAGIAAGSQTVMVSSAVYSRIDPARPAVFSTAVVTDLLRGRLGFSGVVVSDDLGAARAVAQVPAAERARRFLDAGGDLALCADPSLVPAMVEGLRVDRSPARVARSAARVEALIGRLAG